MQWLSLRGRYWNSLRLRIQLWHALVLAVLIISFGSVLYFMQRWTRFREIDNELAAAIEVLNGQLQFVDPSMPTEQGKITVLSVPDTFAPRRVKDAYELPYYILWGPTGEVLHDSRVERSSLISQPGTYAAIRGVRFRNRGEFREAFANGSKGGTVLVGRFIGPDLRDLSELLLVLLVTGITMFIVGLAGGWFISAKSIKPIETIGRVAREISESDLRQRIDTGQMTTELSELSQTLNDTFARLEAAFLRQKQFTADASHELRTPLSVMQIHQQLALSKPRSPEEYRETLLVCQRATTQMHQLVESLLALARLESGSSMATNHSSVSLKTIVIDCVAHTEALVKTRQAHVDANLEEIMVCGDATQLGQVVTNLLINAVEHSPVGVHVTVTLKRESQEVCLTVADTGPGIAAEHLPHLFDRFYRVDQDRSRESGGSGLGLSIVQAIVRSHGGVIEVQSEPGKGTEFKVKLPVCDDADRSGKLPAANSSPAENS